MAGAQYKKKAGMHSGHREYSKNRKKIFFNKE